MKKRVGIITFQGSVNFGAQLQAFALQKTIESLNYDCEVISYSFNNNNKKDKYKNKMKLMVKGLLLNDRAFKKFRKSYNISSEKYCNKDIQNSNNKYDIFVTGSDQVWNPDRTKKTTAYLLEFTDKKKISYAASFGVGEIKDDLYPIYKRCLLRINNVSVREKTGAELYEKITGKKAQVVLDPTLLLNKDEWKSYLNIEDKKDKYVLIYMLEYSPGLVEKAKKFAKSKKMKYKIISGTPRIFYYKNVQWNMSPIKFVKMFYNAEYVFTNSFHGTVFALNFEKQLFVKLLKKNTKVNNRITDVLKMFNASDRIMTDLDCNDDNKVDYNVVSKLVNDQREKSIKFLKESLKDAD